MDVPRPIFNTFDDESMHSVRCTMDRPWSTDGEPRNGHVFLDLDDESPGQLLSTNGLLPARLHCLFRVRGSVEDVDYNCALVQTYKTSPVVREPFGMATCEAVERRPAQYRNGIYRVSYAAGATYIVPVKTIVSTASLVSFRHNPSNASWFINNHID